MNFYRTERKTRRLKRTTVLSRIKLAFRNSCLYVRKRRLRNARRE